MGLLVPRLSPIALALCIGLTATSAVAQEDSTTEPETPDETEPPLPSGLDGQDSEPELPAGLEASGDSEPALPSGIDDGVEQPSEASASMPWQWNMFVDARAGSRVVDDPNEDRASLAELRVQLRLQKSWRPWGATLRLAVDGVGDLISEEQAPDLEDGQGAIDVRSASLTLSPLDWLDLRLGRQVLTWGTGDLLFINDLFPKDWTAFLIGRDLEYLKAPSDVAKLSLFTPVVGFDLAFAPRFDADRLPVRERLSSWDPITGQRVGEDMPLDTAPPDEWGKDIELYARAHKTVKGWELAGYGYYGFWKSPAGFDPMSGAATFPELSVYGLSVRGSVGRGIVNLEGGYYDSRGDRDGDDPFVRNSELRGLVGYERQLPFRIGVGMQYYVEAMTDHGDYERSLPAGSPVADAVRHLATLRLTWTDSRERLRLSAFVFASPSDRDGYLRPSVSYAVSDSWALSAGANLFRGRDPHTFFGQLENNSNVYGALRYSR